MTLRVARWSAQHPWRAVLVWMLFVASAVAASAVITTQETTNADYRVGQSGRADAMLADSGLAAADVENVLITSPGNAHALDQPAAMRAAAEIARRMRSVAGVASVGQPIWNEHRTSLLVAVQLTGTGGESHVDLTDMRGVTDDIQASYPGLRIEQAGEASLDEGIGKQVEGDLAAAETISLPATFGLMLLAFGALVAAGIPVLLAISSVVATIGIYAPISYLVPSEPTVSSMILLIGMAVGVDYSLFYLKREREERARGHGTVDAVEVAAATSGHSIVVSGLAVIVSMAGLYVVQDATFSSLATGAILVVAVAVLGSLTVLPALLSKLGRWVDRPRVPLLWRLNRRIGRGGISRRVLAPVTTYPKVALGIAAVVVLGLGLPALGMQIKSGNLDTLPDTIPEVQTLQRLEAEFPAEGSTVQVVVRASAGDHASVVPALRQLGREAIADGDFVAASGPPVRTSADGATSVLTLASPYDVGTDASERSLDLVRTDLAPDLLDAVPDADWAVGGDVAEASDYAQHQREKLPLVIGFVLLLTLLMMGITFRSVPIALLTTLLNLASVAAAFGVLTLVFQNHWAEGLLDFRSSGFVIDWIPLFLFVVLVGLSMDYHVFVLSRIREGAQRGLPPRVAVEAGVSETAGVVTSAAAVMVSVFAIFATLNMMEMKQMGVGLAVAVLIDATLVRVVMLPSLLVLLGRWAWWPARSRGESPVPITEPVAVPALEPAYAVEADHVRSNADG